MIYKNIHVILYKVNINNRQRIVTLLIMSLLFSVECVYATTGDATWSYGGKSSYTRVMGASTSAQFKYSIGETYGEYKAQIKDPYRWHTVRSESTLKKGTKGFFKRSEGSKDARWRGWVKNGYIRVELV